MGQIHLASALTDIADVFADIIVISANTTLDGEGRAAEVLWPLCGVEAKAAFAPLRASVALGDVIVTPAGRHHAASCILWAVVRDYTRVDVDDADAVFATMPAVWRAIFAAGVTPRHARLRVAMVPLGAADIGIEASATLIEATLPRSVTNDVDVWVCTPDVGDSRKIQRALAAHRTAPWLTTAEVTRHPITVGPPPPIAPPTPRPVVGTPRPRVPPPTARPTTTPAPARTLDSYRKTTTNSARITVLNGCQGVPVGCMGMLIRVQRTDALPAVRVTVAPLHAAEAVAMDGVRAGENIPVRPGPHVLSWMATGKPVFVGVGRAAELERMLIADEVVWAHEPPEGWRAVDFDDRGWTPALAEAQHQLHIPEGAACRWRFSVDSAGKPQP